MNGLLSWTMYGLQSTCILSKMHWAGRQPFCSRREMHDWRTTLATMAVGQAQQSCQLAKWMKFKHFACSATTLDAM